MKSEKNKIYLRLEIDPLMLIFCFKEFFVSKKIIVKKTINNKISKINRYFRFSSFSLIKLLSIKVKKVIKPNNKVIKKIIIKKKFLFKNEYIN